MSYSVKEIFYSLQGEGVNSGKPAIFCRFSGCNLKCSFCDTDWCGVDGENGGVYSFADKLVSAIMSVNETRSPGNERMFVVLTGGEPSLQIDVNLIECLHEKNFEIAVETNGTLPLPPGIDWITVSPKSENDLAVMKGNELKLLYPQKGVEPENFIHLDFQHFLLQPVYGSQVSSNMKKTIEYCLKEPRWRLSLQIHKILNIR